MTDPLVNRFKAALAEGRRQVGFWTALSDPAAIEICAGAGFDWLLLDMEHAPADLRGVQAALQVAAAYPATEAIVRPPVGDAVWIKRLLDIGARTLLIPMVESAAQAAELVAACRYPPRGIRGVAGQTRAARWGRVPDYTQRADESVCLLVQVESAAAATEARAIAAVEGVDGVFIGPADLGASLGELGRFDGPALTQVMAQIAADVRAAGKPVGTLSPDPARAEAQFAEGYAFIAVGMDTLSLSQATTALRRRFTPG
jgi:4-hydroxy-2-oxoheptanedioate aldolase